MSSTQLTINHGKYYKSTYNPSQYRYQDDFVFTTGKRTKNWTAEQQYRKQKLQAIKQKQLEQWQAIQHTRNQAKKQPQIIGTPLAHQLQSIQESMSMISFISQQQSDVSSLQDFRDMQIVVNKPTTIFIKAQLSSNINKVFIREFMIKTTCCDKKMTYSLKNKGRWKLQWQTESCLQCASSKFIGKEYTLNSKNETELGDFSLVMQCFRISMMRMQPICTAGLVDDQSQWLTWYESSSLASKICGRCTQTHKVMCDVRMQQSINEKH